MNTKQFSNDCSSFLKTQATAEVNKALFQLDEMNMDERLQWVLQYKKAMRDHQPRSAGAAGSAGKTG